MKQVKREQIVISKGLLRVTANAIFEKLFRNLYFSMTESSGGIMERVKLASRVLTMKLTQEKRNTDNHTVKILASKSVLQAIFTQNLHEPLKEILRDEV